MGEGGIIIEKTKEICDFLVANKRFCNHPTE